MPTTPLYGFRYPAPADPSDVPLDLQELALDVEAKLNGNLTAANLAPDSVGTSEIAPQAVTAVEMADGTIIALKIADGSVIEAKLAGGAVTTGKIADLSVTTAKIAIEAVNTAQLAPSSVNAAKIPDATITSGKIADGSVTRAKLSSGLIQTGRVGFTSNGGGLSVTVTWATAFADTNYTVSLALTGNNTGGTPKIGFIQTKAAASITVLVDTTGIGNGFTYTLEAIAIHD